MSRRPRDDAGSAVVEFTLLSVALLVPLVYLALAVMSVQRTAYGVTTAVREAGRAFVTADTVAAARPRAEAAARLALADQGLVLPDTALVISCRGGPCLTPGSLVEVRLDLAVPLPFVPAPFDDGGSLSIPVSASHTAGVDRFRSAP
ncbi:MAG: pilus assembly protein [Actinomycetota bacterium]|nr:MAG: pilus assembly protein [Actinomycetota bacterium]